MGSVFSRIVDGELPAHKVHEDHAYLAFLDIQPVRVGHTLVIPKVEIDHLLDLDAETYDGLFAVVRRVGLALRQVFAPPRVGVVVAGFEVPHAHVHVLPIAKLSDTNIESGNRISQTDDELAETAARIRAALAG